MEAVTLADLDDLAVGAAILGTGGGGDPYIGKLVARAAIAEHGPVQLVPLDQANDDWQVLSCGAMGAPTILIEKLPQGEEMDQAVAAWERCTGRAVDALIPFEAGGVNSTAPLALAARRKLPVLDADGMGRAFPRLEMETFNAYGVPACPVAVADEKGNVSIVETGDAAQAEWIARGLTIRMGGQSYIANYGMDGRTAKRVSVPGTVSLAIEIGRVVSGAKRRRERPVEALVSYFATTHYEAAALIGSGKVTDIARREVNGWSVGTVRIETFDKEDADIEVTIQNENLSATQGGRVLAVVPDLISILDRDTGAAISTERLRYGQRVDLLAVRVPEIMRTPEALALFGPKAFGLDHPYVPLGMAKDD
ncbi:DUF917 domain-containing protein [Jiella sp. CQZ9-1]|uniref:DUF917 domain-containing protein n=1 Tax=Jiella flava TaxID=2816857 RepID=A0A939FX89_9HYPH|nr:DUF917 domain-containing protein [Jiella flava]